MDSGIVLKTVWNSHSISLFVREGGKKITIHGRFFVGKTRSEIVAGFVSDYEPHALLKSVATDVMTAFRAGRLLEEEKPLLRAEGKYDDTLTALIAVIEGLYNDQQLRRLAGDFSLPVEDLLERVEDMKQELPPLFSLDYIWKHLTDEEQEEIALPLREMISSGHHEDLEVFLPEIQKAVERVSDHLIQEEVHGELGLLTLYVNKRPPGFRQFFS